MITPRSECARTQPPAGIAESSGWMRLTKSERRVLELLACGLAPKQAAWELGVSIATVRSHIASAKRKTGARTLVQLVWAFAESDTAPSTPAVATLIVASPRTELL